MMKPDHKPAIVGGPRGAQAFACAFGGIQAPVAAAPVPAEA
jgi:hypothetical protein